MTAQMHAKQATGLRNIEPRIRRQRLIIEARYQIDVTPQIVEDYLRGLSADLEMTLHLEPVITSATGKSDPIHDGYEGVIFWLESGAVIYVWDRLKFLTVDIYCCKKFSNEQAIDFTRRFFQTSELEHATI